METQLGTLYSTNITPDSELSIGTWSQGTFFNYVGNEEGMPSVVMPGFSNALNDEDNGFIAAYLRSSRTEKTAWADLETRIFTIKTH